MFSRVKEIMWKICKKYEEDAETGSESFRRHDCQMKVCTNTFLTDPLTDVFNKSSVKKSNPNIVHKRFSKYVELALLESPQICSAWRSPSCRHLSFTTHWHLKITSSVTFQNGRRRSFLWWKTNVRPLDVFWTFHFLSFRVSKATLFEHNLCEMWVFFVDDSFNPLLLGALYRDVLQSAPRNFFNCKIDTCLGVD